MTYLHNHRESLLESLLAHVGTTISGGYENIYTMNYERQISQH